MARKLPAFTQSATPISDLIEAMEKAGAPLKAILVAVKAIEAVRVTVQHSVTVESEQTATETVTASRDEKTRRGKSGAERSKAYRQKQKALRDANRHVSGNENRDAVTETRDETVTPPPEPPLVEVETPKVDEIEEEKKVDIESARVASQEVVDLWNRFAKWCNEKGVCDAECKIATVKTVTEKRRKTIRTRLKTYTVTVMRDGLNVARRTPGLLGHNDQKWVMHFDWFMKPDSIAVILEGKYENWKPTAPIQSARQTHAEAARAAVAGQRRIITGEGEEADYGEPGGTGPVVEGDFTASE